MNHAWVMLQQNLGHSFTNLGLLRAAITHRSVKKDHNERLEFLGDSVLGFIVTEHLFSAHPDANEGLLSHIRSVLVKRSTLAEIARELNLGEYPQKKKINKNLTLTRPGPPRRGYYKNVKTGRNLQPTHARWRTT